MELPIAWPFDRPARGTLASLAMSYARHLNASNRSRNTITNYMGAIEKLEARMLTEGRQPDAEAVTRADVQGLMAAILATKDAQGRLRPGNPGTALNRFKALRAFFNWCVEEDELDVSPMAKMQKPHVPEQPTAVLSEEELVRLLGTCKGRTFEERRDTAIIRLFAETGMRRDELLSLRPEDLDLFANVAMVTGKGGRRRSVPFGPKCAKALDRYLRARAVHAFASAGSLWLTRYGTMKETGLKNVIDRRGTQAGLGHIHPHQFRHTFAHQFRQNGGDDDALMRLAGWRSREMLNRYGASAADERAIEVARRVNLGERY
jgi:site-specific recombinase XerD